MAFLYFSKLYLVYLASLNGILNWDQALQDWDRREFCLLVTKQAAVAM